MRQSTFLMFFLSLVLFISSCVESELVKGIGTGEVKIANTSENELNVVSMETLNVEYTISARENTSQSDYKEAIFTSSDENVFEVDNEGVITGKRNGTARLIVVVKGGKSENETFEVKGSCVVRVTGQKFVEKIEINPDLKNIKINVNETTEFQINPSDYTVYPANALITEVSFASSNPTIASVDKNGLITAISGGNAVISIMSTDGSSIKADINVQVLAPINTWYLEERRNFVFDYRSDLIKYPLIADGSYGNNWNFLIDEGSDWQSSFISFAKPGRAMAPSASIGDIFIPIDMQNKLKFNQIFIRHRSSNTYARLRLWEFDLLGSDNGLDFTVLEQKVEVPGATVDSQNIEATILLDKVYEYRYIKIVPTNWDNTSGNTMQVSDLRIGYDESRDPDFGL